MLKECTVSYENLYQSRPHDINELGMFFRNCASLSDREREICDEPLSAQELYSALCGLKPNTSPGPCGWTAEFFKAFWDEIGELYVAVVNEIFETKSLTTSFSQSITTLIPKKQRDKKYVENFRPISLLPVTYKIIAKCLAKRIAKVIDNLIHPDQTGFIKGRYIGENVRTLLDLLEYTEVNHIPGLLMQCDYYKAYDCIEWDYVRFAMRKAGFGPNFIQWIDIFYPDAPHTARIALNGFLSESYSISRGIRQGCPLSCLVWAICIEPLANAIRCDRLIKGINMEGTELKLSLYADDTTVILDGSEQSLSNTLKVVTKFGKGTGLCLNKEKTACLWIGAKRNSSERLCPEHGLLWTDGTVTVLGIKISTNIKEIPDLNYREKIRDFDNTLSPWSQRHLTPYGRCLLVKSLALSKFTYPFSVLPNPSKADMKRIETSMFRFIWGGSTDKVKRKIAKNGLKNGGLSVPDVESYANALKIGWVKRWFNGLNAKWKLFLRMHFQVTPGLSVFHCTLDVNIIQRLNLNHFWTQTLIAWSKILPQSRNDNEILSQVVWMNKHLRLEESPNINKMRCIAAGIFTVNDLYSLERKRFYTIGELRNKYPTLGVMAINTLKVKTRSLWRFIRSGRPENAIGKTIDQLMEVSKVSKWAYCRLIADETTTYCWAQGKWATELGLTNARKMWLKSFEATYFCTNSIQLRCSIGYCTEYCPQRGCYYCIGQ